MLHRKSPLSLVIFSRYNPYSAMALRLVTGCWLLAFAAAPVLIRFEAKWLKFPVTKSQL